MTTGSVTAGSGVTGLIVNGPAPAILKLIASGTLVLEFADKIACRNEPAPLSLVLVTTSVAACPEPELMTPNRTVIILAVRTTPINCCTFIANASGINRLLSRAGHGVKI